MVQARICEAPFPPKPVLLSRSCKCPIRLAVISVLAGQGLDWSSRSPFPSVLICLQTDPHLAARLKAAACSVHQPTPTEFEYQANWVRVWANKSVRLLLTKISIIQGKLLDAMGRWAFTGQSVSLEINASPQ